jgi:hypothetical protein
MKIVLNLTTQEYFTYNNATEYGSKINKFTTKLNINNALTPDDIGESRWKKGKKDKTGERKDGDHIVIVPEPLQNYVLSQHKYLLIE